MKVICENANRCRQSCCDHRDPHEEIVLHGHKPCGKYKTLCYLTGFGVMVCVEVKERKEKE